MNFEMVDPDSDHHENQDGQGAFDAERQRPQLLATPVEEDQGPNRVGDSAGIEKLSSWPW